MSERCMCRTLLDELSDELYKSLINYSIIDRYIYYVKLVKDTYKNEYDFKDLDDYFDKFYEVEIEALKDRIKTIDVKNEIVKACFESYFIRLNSAVTSKNMDLAYDMLFELLEGGVIDDALEIMEE